MGVSMLAMALGMWLPGLSALTGAIALLGTLSYILCFAVGAGPVPALLIPEINGGRLRGALGALPQPPASACLLARNYAWLEGGRGVKRKITLYLRLGGGSPPSCIRLHPLRLGHLC